MPNKPKKEKAVDDPETQSSQASILDRHPYLPKIIEIKSSNPKRFNCLYVQEINKLIAKESRGRRKSIETSTRQDSAQRSYTSIITANKKG